VAQHDGNHYDVSELSMGALAVYLASVNAWISAANTCLVVP